MFGRVMRLDQSRAIENIWCIISYNIRQGIKWTQNSKLRTALKGEVNLIAKQNKLKTNRIHLQYHYFKEDYSDCSQIKSQSVPIERETLQ